MGGEKHSRNSKSERREDVESGCERRSDNFEMEIGDVCGRKNNREFALIVVKKSVKSREILIEMYYLCFDEFVQ